MLITALYLIPAVLTPLLAVAMRIGAGEERGARIANVAVMISFLFSWAVVVKAPWTPVDDFARIGHIAIGATVLGFALDFLTPKRLVAAIFAGIFVIGAVWSSVTDQLMPFVPTWDVAVLVAILVVVAFLVLARLDSMRARDVTAPVLITVAALSIAFMALIAGATGIFTGALVLALAVVAYAVLQTAVTLPIGDALVLGAGSTLLALAWALGHGFPDVRLPLLLVPLVFFAEGTARRIPLPKARISTILYPLVLAGMAALPCALAVLIAYAMVRA